MTFQYFTIDLERQHEETPSIRDSTAQIALSRKQVSKELHVIKS